MPTASANPTTLSVEHGEDGFVTLAFAVSDHRQNVLTPGVLADLAAALDDLEALPPRRRPRGLVIRSARAGSFFAGADVARIDEVRTLPEAEIARLCDAGRAYSPACRDCHGPLWRSSMASAWGAAWS